MWSCIGRVHTVPLQLGQMVPCRYHPPTLLPTSPTLLPRQSTGQYNTTVMTEKLNVQSKALHLTTWLHCGHTPQPGLGDKTSIVQVQGSYIILWACGLMLLWALGPTQCPKTMRHNYPPFEIPQRPKPKRFKAQQVKPPPPPSNPETHHPHPPEPPPKQHREDKTQRSTHKHPPPPYTHPAQDFLWGFVFSWLAWVLVMVVCWLVVWALKTAVGLVLSWTCSVVIGGHPKGYAVRWIRVQGQGQWDLSTAIP